MNDHTHLGAMASQRFIDGVVDQLKHHMVQPGAIIRVTDVHTRPLAYGIQPLQHLDGRRIIARAFRLALVFTARCGCGHWSFSLAEVGRGFSAIRPCST